MKGSLIIVGFFIAGIACGAMHLLPPDAALGDWSFVALCALMLCVGVSIGSDEAFLKKMRHVNPRLAALPLLTIVGTLMGSAVAGLLLPGRPITHALAVGSGMGYYSLSSIFITQYVGAELGTVALLANVVRELIALTLAPLLLRLFGRLAPIAAGGATTMDTTLPIIARTSGGDMVVVSIFHGFVADLSVPFLVTLFCSL